MTDEKKWYVTVGVHGGEYVVEAESASGAHALLIAHPGIQASTLLHRPRLDNKELDAYLQAMFEVRLRPAPPDLVEWIEAEYGTRYGEADNLRMKCAGGWRYLDRQVVMRDEHFSYSLETVSSTFVPVVLAAGLTVIRGAE